MGKETMHKKTESNTINHVRCHENQITCMEHKMQLQQK